MEVPRCQTLYVNNLNEKVKKEELRRCLYYLFSQFGAILDVVALKTQKMRGQAFIVFRDISSATNALRSLQSFAFFDKPLRLAYARGKSDAIRRLDGSFGDKKSREKRKAEDAGKSRPAKKAARTAEKAATAASSADKDDTTSDSRPSEGGDQTPNKILFATNLPEETNEMMLSMLFQQFPGYKEVRLVPGRSDIAFIEFENDSQSATAKNALQGFKISPSNSMKVSFAKK